MRFPIPPKTTITRDELSFHAIDVEYIELDLRKLFDDYSYGSKLIESFKGHDGLTYELLLSICEWLFSCYKEIKHPVKSNRILNFYILILMWANDAREY